MEEIILTIRDGKPTATSLQIAESFEKEHRNVLQSIRDLINDLERTEGGRRFSLLNFQQRDLQNSRGRTYPAYSLTRDGFTLLAMGFTGDKALHFKMAYIDAFNRMEAELAAKLPALPGIPPMYKPQDITKTMIPWRLRCMVNAIDFVNEIQEKINDGNGYMLPIGMETVHIPGMTFLGWYSDSTLLVNLGCLKDPLNWKTEVQMMQPYAETTVHNMQTVIRLNFKEH